MITLSLEHILEIHAIVIEETGGPNGLRDLGRLESAIATQTQNVFGQELYETVIRKAAAMIRNTIIDHPFVDGNKRTAMLAGLTFLKLNTINVKFEAREIEDFAVSVVTNHLAIEEIDSWITKHVV